MQEPQSDWTSAYPPPTDLTDPNLLFGLPYGGSAMDFNAWTTNPGPEELCGYIEGFDEQYMY